MIGLQGHLGLHTWDFAKCYHPRWGQFPQLRIPDSSVDTGFIAGLAAPWPSAKRQHMADRPCHLEECQCSVPIVGGMLVDSHRRNLLISASGVQLLWRYNREAVALRIQFLNSNDRRAESCTALVRDVPGIYYGSIPDRVERTALRFLPHFVKRRIVVHT